MRSWLVYAALFTVIGCRFDTRGVGLKPDLTGEPKDSFVTADSDATALDDQRVPDDQRQLDGHDTCGWPYAPAHFDPCLHPLPPDDHPLVLSSGKDYRYDSESGLLSDSSGEVSAPSNSIVDGVRVIWTLGLAIEKPATLRVVGAWPLMIVSAGQITIDGTIDVSTSFDEAAGFELGAGASRIAQQCDLPPERGVHCGKHGASGGGGGGFGSAGSGGDAGGVGHDCGDGDVSGRSPTDGGPKISGWPDKIRAGCAGADGAHTEEGGAKLTDRGIGAPGGGAVHLTAQTLLTVRGEIQAGGAGGKPGLAHRASGGGGGSGGYIGLESRSIHIEQSALLAANGGGGGGGCDDSTATRGDDGHLAAEAAPGGAAEGSGGRGNDGAYLAVAAEAPETTIERGGGGGGGGVGFILLHVLYPNVSPDASISPPEIRVR